MLGDWLSKGVPGEHFTTIEGQFMNHLGIMAAKCKKAIPNEAHISNTEFDSQIPRELQGIPHSVDCDMSVGAICYV
jgi:hypothetical protein